MPTGVLRVPYLLGGGVGHGHAPSFVDEGEAPQHPLLHACERRGPGCYLDDTRRALRPCCTRHKARLVYYDYLSPD